MELELGNQIKTYRTDMNLSQEELADKIYVTRQTISNWENNKSYPDIHSLLLLSSLFHVSLDQFIKGDVQIMKETINKADKQAFNRDSVIFSVLLVLFIITIVPLVKLLSYYGLLISAALYAVSMFYALKLEKFKKKFDIQTYREIVAFTEGKKLDEIEKTRESGKRHTAILSKPSAFLTFILLLSIQRRNLYEHQTI